MTGKSGRRGRGREVEEGGRHVLGKGKECAREGDERKVLTGEARASPQGT